MIAGILGAAISGVNLNSQRVSAAAKNIANVSTPGYQPEKVEATSVVTGQSPANAYQPGGVQSVTRTALVDVNGVVGMQPSATDLGTEFANMIMAEKAYSASLKAMSVAEDMTENLFDVVG